MHGSPLTVLLAAACLAALFHCGGVPAAPEAPAPKTMAQAPARLRLRFQDATPGGPGAAPVYAVCTCLDGSGRFCRLDASGRLRPCSPADNVVVLDGRTWCDYAFPVHNGTHLDLDPVQAMVSARIYLSVGAPLRLRVDEATGGLVQPDPANPTDPNRAIPFDWIEFALDRSGFHGNTTCVDQFGLPIALSARDRSDPRRRLGPVGLTESRSALFAEYRASVPPAFQALVDPGGCRILAPAHGGFAASGPQRDYLQGYIDQMWAKYRTEPLCLTPDEGTFTGQVDAHGRMVFAGAGGPFVIQREPTSQEVLLCDGVLAQGSSMEKVLGAQVAAMLNRHVLETPLAWRRAAGYYRREPCNHYAQFWHDHGLGHLAYGFAYDDVNDQSPSLYVPAPLEIDISYRMD